MPPLTITNRNYGLLAIVDACRAVVDAWETVATTEGMAPSLDELCRVLTPLYQAQTCEVHKPYEHHEHSLTAGDPVSDGGVPAKR